MVIAAVLCLTSSAGHCYGQKSGTNERLLPALTTAQEAHDLTANQAAQGYPVHLRVVVTYYDARGPACFASDSSGGIYIDLRGLHGAPLHPGDIVEVKGVSQPGGYAPIVVAGELAIVGKSSLPPDPPLVTMTRILTGALDGQWVRVEGVVHAVRESETNVDLFLALSDGEIMASTVRQAGVHYRGLVDTAIAVSGNTAPLFDSLGQMSGFYLLFPGAEQVKAEGLAPPDPFSSPASPITGLLRFNPAPSVHRIHVRGTVTLFWPGRLLCIQDGPSGLCAQTAQTTPLRIGEATDVIGFATAGAFTRALTNATYRPAAYQPDTPARPLALEDATRGSYDGELVEVEGLLIGHDDFASDPSMVLSSHGHSFSVVLPEGLGGWKFADLEKETKIRVVGIWSVRDSSKAALPSGDFSTLKSFHLLLRSPLDLVVIQTPSWWTPRHALETVGAACLSVFGVLLWVTVLRKRVHGQTETIRNQLVQQQRSSAMLAEQAEELSQQTEELFHSREAFEAQALMLQGVLNSMHEGLVAADEHGKFLIWNPAAERILGHEATALPPDQWSAYYGFYLPDGVTPIPPGQSPLARAIRGEAVATEMLVRNSALEHEIWVEASSSPLRDKEGVLRGGMVALRDITRRKADEVEIRELNLGLEKKIATRTSELETANRDLESFSYSVSHNLRAPLRHVVSYSSIVMKDFGEEIPLEARALLQRIEDAVRRMSGLIDALLVLVKLVRQPLRCRHTGLNTLVDHAIASLGAQTAGRAVEWRIAQLPSLDCDPVLVSQAFHILLDNALKYSRCRNPAIIEIDSIAELNQPVIIRTRDNGIGFDLAYAERLFRLFQRMHSEAEFEGTGVGLATVRRIVEKHGGTIWAEAEVDRGAVFYFTLQGCSNGPAAQRATDPFTLT
jgi:signal transduction histidine kinase